MKLLIYSTNFAPEPTGIGKYSGEMASWLGHKGHEVRVICAPPYYPAWKVDPAYKHSWYRNEIIDGVKVLRCPLWVPEKPGGLKRIVHLLSFALFSFPVAMAQIFWRPDAVVTIAPALVCAPGALLLARLSGAKSWLHIQDFELDVAFEMGLIKGKWLKKLLYFFERFLFNRFDAISSISRSMLARLLGKNVVSNKIHFFPNWVDISNIHPLDRMSSYREQLNISSEQIVLLFSGSLGGKQGLLTIPKAARLLGAEHNLVFVICGNGVMKPELEAEAQDLPNFIFLPIQPLEQLNELLALADIHLLTQDPSAADLVLPSKLTGMLASGKPILATCHADTEISNIVSTCGVIAPPGDPEALAKAIALLANDAELRHKLGVLARQYAEQNLSREVILQKFNTELSVLLG